MAATDLTREISPFLDRHLVFPLLEFLQDRRVYPDDEILKAKIDLLGKTNMVDYAMDIFKSLYKTEEAPEGMVQRRGQVLARLNELEEKAAPIVGFLNDPALVVELRPEKQYNLKMLEDKFQIDTEKIEALYSYAKFQFECGNYSGAADYLYQYRQLASNNDRVFSSTWGRLAAEVLTGNWDSAAEELARLKDMIDSKGFCPPAELLQHRTWLLHWALFIQLSTENGRSDLIDLFMQDKYLNALQTNAPHLVRYLAAAVLTCKRRRNAMKDVIRVLQQEQHKHSDALTRFVLALFSDFDFDEAQSRLKECDELLQQDYFLGRGPAASEDGSYAGVTFRDELVDCARMFMFETYCRLHRRMDIKVLADKLDMTADAAERWIANLIRTAKLNATIDSECGTIIMATPDTNVYETLIERSRGLAVRSYSLASNVIATAVTTTR